MPDKKKRKFRVVATVDEFVGGSRDIPPVTEWDGQWLEDMIDSWGFNHMDIESVEEIDA